MKNSQDPPQAQEHALPPSIARYLEGPPPESRQFDFLLGDWTVDNTRYKEDGSVLMKYTARWTATTVSGGRMVMDDFKGYLPNGPEFYSVATLRTYNETTQRWDLAMLYAHEQPAKTTEFYGVWTNGEMVEYATGTDPTGRAFLSRIRFFNIDKNSFDWELKVSMDAGKTWGVAAVATATRAAH